ncbi:hypothetical protein WJX73_001402 [Symbiochloris irregularis]|uniref:Uncharacterized protein n=1 Tax=Symbiochloris irregularis TaxID=706552 RepID=A0AAW1NRT9_9CHLO
MLEFLPKLQQLQVRTPPDAVYEWHGFLGFFQILGRLTALTRLSLEDVWAEDASGLDLAHLSTLSLLQQLNLEDVTLCDFDVPSTWSRLETLTLQDCEVEWPGNLSALASLTWLTLEIQAQIREPMDFLTQLKSLRTVALDRGVCGHVWDPSSLCAIVQAQLLIEETPDCHVELLA